ncbi:MAG TPA: hypothetical protein VLL98_04135 [Rickettsiales bacterium]|nr:hypothetical protein [Rickettsiales bacterium]
MDNFKTLIEQTPKIFIKSEPKTLNLDYINSNSTQVRINLILNETFEGTDEILEHDSLLKGAYFLVETGLKEIVFFGGSLMKNNLDISKTKIDDFDTGYFDTDTKRGEEVVSKTLQKLKETGNWQIIERGADKIRLPLAQEKIDFFLESGVSAFLISSNPEFFGHIFEFGNEDTMESTLNMENTSASLSIKSEEKISNSLIYNISCSLRGKEWKKSLKELKNRQANINRNVENFTTKFDILQRFLVTTIKYGVSLSDNSDKESALFILQNFEDNDFLSPKNNGFKKASTREDLIILEKRKEFCLNKFFNLLTRITPLKREIYLHDLVKSKILIPFLPEVHKVFSNLEVRKQLLKNEYISGALNLYNFVSKINSETKDLSKIKNI